MIAYVRGRLAETRLDTVVIEVGSGDGTIASGIGYEIFVPASVYDGLPPIGEEVTLYTYFHVREDVMQLFGFLERDSLEMFRLLLQVNGIGPKGAIGILSVITPNELRFAILADDAKTISKAPGVGAKTARKLILDLKDKIHPEEVFGQPVSGTSKHNLVSNSSSGINQIKREAAAALEALGYSATESLHKMKIMI